VELIVVVYAKNLSLVLSLKLKRNEYS